MRQNAVRCGLENGTEQHKEVINSRNNLMCKNVRNSKKYEKTTSISPVSFYSIGIPKKNREVLSAKFHETQE